MSDSIVEMENVSKHFEAASGAVHAVEDLSLSVRPREFVSLIGPSGCGKSTLLRLIAGLLAPTEGRIVVDGKSPEQVRKERGYSFVFQDPVMLPWRTVVANVELALELAGGRRDIVRQQALDLMQKVGLQGFEHVRPVQLSGGMRQRAALARALTVRPRLLLLDEPFGALDEITRAQMNSELLKILREHELTAILVTHSIEEAVFLSDRVLVLSPRPGTIRASIAVDLPRPRHRAMKQTRAFFDHLSAIRRVLEVAPGGDGSESS